MLLEPDDLDPFFWGDQSPSAYALASVAENNRTLQAWSRKAQACVEIYQALASGGL